MLRRKGLALVAACAALACGGLVRAADTASSSDVQTPSAYSTNQPVMMDEAAPADSAPARKPLMWLLDKAGVAKTLDDAGINIYGYVEGSWSYSANHPAGSFIGGRAFDYQEQSIILNQLDLTVERTVDTTKGKFDVGFRVEQIYGTDASLIHSNGMTVYSPTKIGLFGHPKEQYDLNQAYIDLAVPVGKGLLVRIGKWNTLLGYEVISPNGNALYSHSFLFTQLPFTQTGVLATYNLTDNIGVTGGFSRGWDQALDDVNGSLDATGQIKYVKDKIALYLNGITGPERPSGTTSGWRTVFDFIGVYNYSDNLTLALNADYGFEPQIDFGKTGQWYGAAVYAGYKITDMFTLNARGEWFDDPDGAAPASFNAGTPNQYYELTLGVAVHPFPTNNIGSNLVFRPEVRWDYADKPTWPGNDSHNQLTFALEGYFTF
jgi:hypothetical protein